MEPNSEQTAELAEEPEVIDDEGSEEGGAAARYDITSFGADFDVDGLVKRLRTEEIFVPSFQREYVWTINDASRFIESLLLGLPVPGIFLARESTTNKFLVIDGQQRLKTLLFFYDGYFNPKPVDKSKRIFKLKNVHPRFEGLTYENLEEKDRLQLDNSIIHATIIKQDSPADDDTSVYHVFERLNSGGKRLAPQEIRVATSHGRFLELVTELNETPAWRLIFGKKSPRLKDQEMILRFLAMYFDSDRYQRPIGEFLNKFAQRNRNPNHDMLQTYRQKFTSAIETAANVLGTNAFRPLGPLNAAVFDSVLVGIARRLDRGPIKDTKQLAEAYKELLMNDEYQQLVSTSTSDERNVRNRLEKATTALAQIE